jgi:hypothetical protein
MARTATVLLLGGDYAERLEALYREVLAAEDAQNRDDAAPKTLLEDPVGDLAKAYAELKAEAEAEAEQNQRRVTMIAVGRREWRALKDKHPARTEGPDAEGDSMAGVNTDTVEDDLVYACLTHPEFTSRAAFDEWADTLSEGEWRTLVIKAWELVNGARFDPKPLPASLIPSTAPN